MLAIACAFVRLRGCVCVRVCVEPANWLLIDIRAPDVIQGGVSEMWR